MPPSCGFSKTRPRRTPRWSAAARILPPLAAEARDILHHRSGGGLVFRRPHHPPRRRDMCSTWITTPACAACTTRRTPWRRWPPAQTLGISAATMREALHGYAPPPHRCELIRTLDGVEYLNDSKATNLHALESALRSQTRPVVLIAGGKEKGLDYSPVVPAAAREGACHRDLRPDRPAARRRCSRRRFRANRSPPWRMPSPPRAASRRAGPPSCFSRAPRRSISFPATNNAATRSVTSSINFANTLS